MAKRRRFYRANLPTVIWDKENNRALAEFRKGEFITGSDRVANILIEKGYPEVELDADEPPDFEVPRGKSIDSDIKIMPPKYNEKAALNKQLSKAALEKANRAGKAGGKSTPKVVKPKREVKRRGRKRA